MYSLTSIAGGRSRRGRYIYGAGSSRRYVVGEERRKPRESAVPSNSNTNAMDVEKGKKKKNRIVVVVVTGRERSGEMKSR